MVKYHTEFWPAAQQSMRPLGTEKTTLHSINIQQGWEKNDLHARLSQVRLCHKIFQSHLVKPYYKFNQSWMAELWLYCGTYKNVSLWSLRWPQLNVTVCVTVSTKRWTGLRTAQAHCSAHKSTLAFRQSNVKWICFMRESSTLCEVFTCRDNSRIHQPSV